MRERESKKEIKAEKEREKRQKDYSRVTACTPPETELPDLKFQISVLSVLIVAKAKVKWGNGQEGIRE